MISSLDRGFRQIGTLGAAYFPCDDLDIAKFEDRKKARVTQIKADLTNLQFLEAEDKNGDLLVRKDAKPTVGDLRALGEDGVVGLYFSAHWCPPCQFFTPELVKYYEKLKAASKKFEVVFIS